MKKYKNIVILFVILMTSVSCGDSTAKMNRFANAYYEILIAREQYQDSLIANKKVAEVLQKFGFSQEEFAKESFRLYNEDQLVLTKMIDSLRKKAEKEINDLSRKKLKSLDSNGRDKE